VSELAYAGVVYLRMIDSVGDTHLSIVTSASPFPVWNSVALICSICRSITWTDSTIVLNWLVGNPRRFKTYVGNRISCIVELISPERWRHVNATEYSADSASRGLFLSELVDHELWWNGPEWLKLPSTDWPKPSIIPDVGPSDEEREVCIHTTIDPRAPVIPLDRFSHFEYVTAWILRFINNCQTHDDLQASKLRLPLSAQELSSPESY
jgi:hypothetical protein